LLARLEECGPVVVDVSPRVELPVSTRGSALLAKLEECGPVVVDVLPKVELPVVVSLELPKWLPSPETGAPVRPGPISFALCKWLPSPPRAPVFPE